MKRPEAAGRPRPAESESPSLRGFCSEPLVSTTFSSTRVMNQIQVGFNPLTALLLRVSRKVWIRSDFICHQEESLLPSGVLLELYCKTGCWSGRGSRSWRCGSRAGPASDSCDPGVLLSTGPDRFPMRRRTTEEDECWCSRPTQWHFFVHACI